MRLRVDPGRPLLIRKSVAVASTNPQVQGDVRRQLEQQPPSRAALARVPNLIRRVSPDVSDELEYGRRTSSLTSPTAPSQAPPAPCRDDYPGPARLAGSRAVELVQVPPQPLPPGAALTLPLP